MGGRKSDSDGGAMTNEELFEMFRASGEVSFPVFLDKYIDFVEPKVDITFANGSQILLWEESNE